MLEPLMRWLQLESSVFVRDAHGDVLYTYGSDDEEDWQSIISTIGRHFEDMPDMLPFTDSVIEYAVRHAVEARGLFFNTMSKHRSPGEKYRTDLDNADLYVCQYGSSPAESILKAYVGYLEHINSQEKAEV